MTATLRRRQEELHRLIDCLSVEDAADALAYIEYLIDRHRPVKDEQCGVGDGEESLRGCS